ncbi:phosphoribosyltransferase [Actinoplanes solisilvae]|uniref:phosphoribosyltransferase n=1 Tax=Actinoplanes solisilvae TaxID=2486853 RepID=UPI000FD98C64|nr:phosphoribosyltransferase [Actinoplanes solisilvae]
MEKRDQVSEYETLTWSTFGWAARQLAQAVADDGFRPDLVLTVARGGLLPAGAVGYALDVKDIRLINVEFYTGIQQRRDRPVLLPPVPPADELAGAKVLVVDDVADTGATLDLVRDFCAEQVAEARCAVLYEKPHSTVKCEYVWSRTDRWIRFPWSGQPPVVVR